MGVIENSSWHLGDQACEMLHVDGMDANDESKSCCGEVKGDRKEEVHLLEKYETNRRYGKLDEWEEEEWEWRDGSQEERNLKLEMRLIPRKG